MSYFDDYIADGFCCTDCGVMVDGSECGYPRKCADCTGAARRAKTRTPRGKRLTNTKSKQPIKKSARRNA